MHRKFLSVRKPLSFSTTMRNPHRIGDFLKCLLPYEGGLLTEEIIMKVAHALIKTKKYQPVYINKVEKLKKVLQLERDFSDKEVWEIIKNSPQQHKEAGFAKGWPSRFDTWYKLSKEFGFVFYKMGEQIRISTTGHMLVDALNEKSVGDEKIKNIFLNALIKYQTNNPFRKNANSNSPLLLLLQVISLLKRDKEESDAGIYRKELSFFICWPDNNAEKLYKKIKETRGMYGFNYGDEVVYEECLKLLEATDGQKNRFKQVQIVGEAVDEFIRKMRITGVISLRGNGNFIDFNKYEETRIKYLLEKYKDYPVFDDEIAFFNYIGEIDPKIILLKSKVSRKDVLDRKKEMLNWWALNYSEKEIYDELKAVCSKKPTQNEVLKIIDAPVRLEFLTSVALKQNLKMAEVVPNYSSDDEGLPIYTAPGGCADIECRDKIADTLVEVTLICSREQGSLEIPAITRHLESLSKKSKKKVVFSIFVAPFIHRDTKYMVNFTKYHYNLDIFAWNVVDFIEIISKNNNLLEISKSIVEN